MFQRKKVALHECVLDYFSRSGFRKTVKRFQSEAQIQSDDWKASSPHLEDQFCKYNTCNGDSNISSSNKPVVGKDEAIKTYKVCSTNEEKPIKKKKKGTVESDNGANKHRLEVIDKKMVESSRSYGPISEDTIVDEQETKPKKKKKTKHDLETSTDALKKPADDTINGLKIDDSTKKTKDKKKKSNEQDKLEPSTTNENELVMGVAEKERKKKKKKKVRTDSAFKDEKVNTVKTHTENETISRKEKESSKKRKRSCSDEHANLSTEITTTEESKCQKMENSKVKSKKESIDAQETSNKLLDEHMGNSR